MKDQLAQCPLLDALAFESIMSTPGLVYVKKGHDRGKRMRRAEVATDALRANTWILVEIFSFSSLSEQV